MAKSSIPLTQERLKQLLDYDPETGVFTWRAERRYGHAGIEAGYVSKESGYRIIGIDRQGHYRAQRLAWFYVKGKWPKRLDHINLIRSDNRWTNLREATGSQNLANAKKHRDNTSGFKGVHKCSVTGRWRAKICVEYRQIHLGRFNTKEEAAEAYAAAAKRYFGEFARTK